MKKKLLFLNQEQFGYHIDYVQYCNHLVNDFDITYLCWDYKWEKIITENIEIIYISRKGNLLQRNYRFIMSILKQLKNHEYYFVFIHYFRGCSIIPLLFNNKFQIHLDIRTGSISKYTYLRNINNVLLRKESSFFRSISIISNGLQKLLKISQNVYILPLGAKKMKLDRKVIGKICLLYIGTFHNRQIEDTITGLSIFLKKNPSANIYYYIIGKGWDKENEFIKRKIDEFDLSKYIELKGYIPHNRLGLYFEKSNVGISYIPQKPYFEFQPATKTFEYLMAGIPVIATGTYANRQIINKKNGIIIEDTPDSFARGLELLYYGINTFNEETIKSSVEEFEWIKIVNDMKKNILLKEKNELFSNIKML